MTSTPPTPSAHNITGIILAGGQGRRMGGCNKGLQRFGAHSLVEHVVMRLQPQVGQLAINANHNLAEYERLGFPVWPDLHPEFAGPLAGVQTSLHHCNTRYLLTVPCDCPFLPMDLVERLLHGLHSQSAELAVAVTETSVSADLPPLRQAHPVFCLLDSSLLEHLNAFLQGGGRKFSDWYRDLRVAQVVFNDEQEFRNINTREQLQAWQAPGQVGAMVAVASVAAEAASRAISQQTQAMPASPMSEYLQTLSDYQPDALPLPLAQKILQTQCRAISGHENLPLRQALGRILAQDVMSSADLPAHDNAAMDGYALRSADLQGNGPSVLQIVGQALAGHPFFGQVEPGQCVRIMTGAVLPAGCDAVIAQEHVLQADQQSIRVPEGLLKSGSNRRQRGEDLRAGQLALARGSWLHAPQLGLLASLGQAEVCVQRRLRVAFFSTGDELRPLGSTLPEGCLYDSNRVSLYAMLSRLGCEVLDMGSVPDQPQAIRAALSNAAAHADAVITSGGMAGGDADFTRSMMQELGEVHFWHLQMRPGRPFAFGHLHQPGRSTALFGLPGNPVALMVSFYMLVRPALLQMMGAQVSSLPQMQAMAAHPIRKVRGRHEFQRGIISQNALGHTTVSLSGAQGSNLLLTMSQANCLLCLGPELGDIQTGQMLAVLPLEGLQ